MRFLLIFLFLGYTCYSQIDGREIRSNTVAAPAALQNQGVIHYGEVQSMGLGGPVGPEYNAILVFNINQSLFVTRQDSLEGGNINGLHSCNTPTDSRAVPIYTNKEGFNYFQDLSKNMLYSRDIGFMYVKEPIPQIKWKVHPETKRIGKFKVKKATADFRGRQYTAWYTTELPLPFGPWKLNGLPGLILEAYDTNREIYWYFKDYQEVTPIPLKQIDNGGNNWMNFQQYRSRLLHAYQNMINRRSRAADKNGLASESKVKMSDIYIENFQTYEN